MIEGALHNSFADFGQSVLFLLSSPTTHRILTVFKGEAFKCTREERVTEKRMVHRIFQMKYMFKQLMRHKGSSLAEVKDQHVYNECI